MFESKGSYLVETNPYEEKIWSCGLPEGHPDIQNPKKYPGKNLTGEILMRVRDELMQSPQYAEEIEELNDRWQENGFSL